MKKAFLLALFALPLLCGCFPPDLPLKPASYVRLDGRILIDGKAYPLGFSWKEENRAAWDEGRGWHTEWVSSDKSLVRIVGSEHAVVVWLPQAGADLHEFRPTTQSGVGPSQVSEIIEKHACLWLFLALRSSLFAPKPDL